MSSMTITGSNLGVLARQEIRNYLRHKLFWFGTALVLVLDVVILFNLDGDPGSSGSYMIGPAALLGVLGLVVMYGLTRRSDRAAEAAGVVAVPERTRTLALAAATVVPLSVALVSYVVALVTWYVHPPADYVVPPGISSAFVFAQMFGDGVVCAVGGPILGLVLARYLPRRGTAAVASVLLVIVTILLQGSLTGGDQPYRVLWAWTYFLTQRSVDGVWHMGTLPGNPFIWVLYLLTLCALGVVVAVRHDPESDRVALTRAALALGALALVLGVLTMTVGFTEAVISPGVCGFC
jgi:hypothetical protein